MMLLSEFTPELMQYSIDEAFIDLTGMGGGEALREYGKRIVRTIGKGTGIPVTLGIAPTKTLAKVASRYGKKYKGYGGVCLIDTEEKRIKALQGLTSPMCGALADALPRSWNTMESKTHGISRSGVKAG